MLVLTILMLALSILCSWILVSKTGHPGWMSLLFLIPVVNLILWLYLAFSEWPIEAELRRYKERCGDLLPEAPADAAQDDVSTETTCLECGKPIPAGATACASCGWTYKAPSAPGPQPSAESTAAKLDPANEFYRSQRGF